MNPEPKTRIDKAGTVGSLSCNFLCFEALPARQTPERIQKVEQDPLTLNPKPL